MRSALLERCLSHASLQAGMTHSPLLATFCINLPD
jgi:hypothetical protein